MKKAKVRSTSLASYLDKLQSSGRYTFTQQEALKTLGMSLTAFHRAKIRLEKQNRILSPKAKFYIIVPTEYKASGAPPVSWFIDDLMKYLNLPYYVGLLSAAALHGASHQAVQETQIIVPKATKMIEVKRLRIRFFIKRDIKKSPTVLMRSQTGDYQVSTPEVTAFDLVRYYKGVGYFSHVLTVLTELSERLDPKRLLAVAKLKDTELTLTQRLGYLLDRIKRKDLTTLLQKWVTIQKPFPALLRPGPSRAATELNDKWQILVNEEIEADI